MLDIPKMTNGLVQHVIVEESISIQRDNYINKIGTVCAVSFDICLLSEMTFQEFKDVLKTFGIMSSSPNRISGQIKRYYKY